MVTSRKRRTAARAALKSRELGSYIVFAAFLTPLNKGTHTVQVQGYLIGAAVGASIEFGCTGIELPYRLRKIRLSRPAHRIRRFAEANAGSNGSHRGVAETTQDASTTCLQG